MPTKKQLLGKWGETLIAKRYACPRCKRFFTLRRLPPNFKCADVICDFCGYLAQVKTVSVADVSRVPTSILGAAWEPQRLRMKAGIYFPLFIVLKNAKNSAVYYLPTEFQMPGIFKKRKPLSETAKRAGWQGFVYDLAGSAKRAIIRLDNPNGRGRARSKRARRDEQSRD